MASTHNPLFSRRNLWLMILLLIPLIQILNSLGGSGALFKSPKQPIADFDLAELTIQQSSNHAGVFYVNLPTDALVIAIAVNELPNSIAQFNHPSYKQSMQNGYFISQFSLQLEDALISDTLDFMGDWLPPLNEHSKIVIVGPAEQKQVDWIWQRLSNNQGKTAQWHYKEHASLTKIRLPMMGSEQMPAFQVAVDILSKRLAGYDIAAKWHFQSPIAELTLNTTLLPEHLRPSSDDEFAQSIYEFQLGAKQTRSAAQIASYISRMAIYDLSPEFVTQAPTRFDDLKKSSVDRILSESFSL